MVFTCVTDTGRLAWDITIDNITFHHHLFSSQAQITNPPINSEIFNITLNNITGNSNKTFHSTLTADHVPITYDGTIVACIAQANPHPIDKLNKTIMIGLLEVCNNFLQFVILVLESPPSRPLNLKSSSTLSSVNISWVAPQDTPLCVHSYTVTIRNSCNSYSQVLMVYNTTDNKSSLNANDLTSGVYSVTVAGRDEAGRLGQESEELMFIFKGI